jgi:hypothetical protein
MPRHRFKPPRAMFFRADLLPVQQVGFADDSDDVVTFIDHRQRADVVFGKKLDRFGHLVVWLDRDNVANHHIKRFHPVLRRPVCLPARTLRKGAFGYTRVTA